MLDAPTIKHLVDAGMNVEDAVMKAPEESVANLENNFIQQLYKKKYPPKGHVYVWAVTNPFIYSLQIDWIWQTCKIPQVTAVNCWEGQQLLSQMIQSYSCFLQCRKGIYLCQLNMQFKGSGLMFNHMKLNCWWLKIIELYFQVGDYLEKRQGGGRRLRIYCGVFHTWYVKLDYLAVEWNKAFKQDVSQQPACLK